jgi:hypothetical protein
MDFLYEQPGMKNTHVDTKSSGVMISAMFNNKINRDNASELFEESFKYELDNKYFSLSENDSLTYSLHVIIYNMDTSR